MTRFAETGDKFFTVYVPRAAAQTNGGGATVPATQESYLRLGRPDAATEQAFLGSLQGAYTEAGSQTAVEAAFGASPTAGITMYTEGDLVQFVNGKADTRVLNDSYVVHVLNREDTAAASGGAQTYRAYLRLGKPNTAVEAPLRGARAPDQLESDWSLGEGVALYSDKAVTVTTPETYRITVGKNSRTVLGQSYSETYDVSEDVLDQIKDGTIREVSAIPDKRLVTAAMTSRDLAQLSWRTTKLDLSKNLSFGAADNGSFIVGSDYTFWAGLKLSNSLGVSFEASTGAAISAPLGAKVELTSEGIETAWAGGKVSYTSQQTLKGDSIQLSIDPAAKATSHAMKPLGNIIRIGMGVVNGALAAYTSAFAGIGANTTSDSDGATANVKEMMEAGEGVYVAAAGLNAVLAAITLVAGVVQIATEKAANAATGASAAQPTNIIMNDAGIKLQVGTNYVHIGASGIVISGTQVLTASPMSSFVPASPPANSTPANLLQQAKTASNAGKKLTKFV